MNIVHRLPFRIRVQRATYDVNGWRAMVDLASEMSAEMSRLVGEKMERYPKFGYLEVEGCFIYPEEVPDENAFIP